MPHPKHFRMNTTTTDNNFIDNGITFFGINRAKGLFMRIEVSIKETRCLGVELWD